MTKRSFLAASAVIVMIFSLGVSASANTQNSTIDNADSYVADNLSGTRLVFDASADTASFTITASALNDFYYNPNIRSYYFKLGDFEIDADKNNFMDFDLKNVKFTISNAPSFNVVYTYNDGSTKQLSEVRIDNTYSYPYKTAERSFAPYFTPYSSSGRFITANVQTDSRIEFTTNLIGKFNIRKYEFSDIKNSGKWYYKYVNSLGSKGILNGMGDGTFAPSNPVTRAELATMFVKATEHIISYRLDTSKSFKDVPKGKWYYEYVMKCASLGIVNGYGDGNFGPNNPATREEVAVMIRKIVEAIGSFNSQPLPQINSSTSKAELAKIYKDSASISSWSRDYVLFCNKLSIMIGDENKNFSPKADITRAECAKIIYDIYFTAVNI